jgi:hypothetical protein
MQKGGLSRKVYKKDGFPEFNLMMHLKKLKSENYFVPNNKKVLEITDLACIH